MEARLTREEWEARQRAHEARVDAWTGPHLRRRAAGVAHPVEDFLFTYYSCSPAALRRWHPGAGVVLEDAADRAGWRGYTEVAGGAAVATALLDQRRALLASTERLLRATAARRPRLSCFGMHEWAMVYRLPQGQVRHERWPLRLGSHGTDAVVESHDLACSHFDAYRFFTDEARPLNALRPSSEDRAAFEQPGCLHAGMDLYRHAYRLLPMICSELVADCFALAREIRVLDMRASPYDLSGLGLEPVRVETPDGKQEYAAAQRAFAERAAPLRARLLRACERLLAAAAVHG